MLVNQKDKNVLCIMQIFFNYKKLIVVFLAFALPIAAQNFQLGGHQLKTGMHVNAAFATLIIDEKSEKTDAEICEALTKSGIKGFYSKSTAWAFVNNFEGIEQVSLDKYDKRVTAFDPRNDGYAERVGRLFTAEGKRIIYIPSSALTFTGEAILASALSGIPYTLEWKSAKQDSTIFFVFFIAVCILSIYLVVRSRKWDYVFALVCGLPALSLLAAYGAGGFALSAVILAVFRHYEDALRYYAVMIPELSIFKPSNTPCDLLPLTYITGEEKQRTIIKLSLFAALFLAVAFLGSVNIVAAILSIILFSLAVCASIAVQHASTGQSKPHSRFIYIPIKPNLKAKQNLYFYKLPLIWTFCAFTVFFTTLITASQKSNLPSAQSRAVSSKLSKIKNSAMISEADYIAHLEFQKNFAFTKLKTGNADKDDLQTTAESGQYMQYKLESSGIFTQVAVNEPKITAKTDGLPHFNMGKLLNFLQTELPYASPAVNPLHVLSPLCSLLLYIIFAMLTEQKKINYWDNLIKTDIRRQIAGEGKKRKTA
ncbi:MAG: hypothetical protein Ta2F_07410 [Termitinemataceae bacterium]|nr:MAG: hypothetical protein Ta2F_07410 [Termitinemataceae bacterium]